MSVPIAPRSHRGDQILLADGRLLELARVIRRFDCARATDDERRHGCYWVTDTAGEEYVVTADVSGLRSRTFRPCSNS